MLAVKSDVNVDLDLLHDFLRKELRLKSEKTPKFMLYGRTSNSVVKGFQAVLSSTAYIQLPSSITNRQHSESPAHREASRVLMHESGHLVDSLDRKVRSIGETALAIGVSGLSAIAAYQYGRLLPEMAAVPVDASAYVGMQLLYRWGFDPRELRTHKIDQNEELVSQYQNIISLPDIHD